MERDTERDRVQQAWEEVGSSVASALDAASAVVVIGDDPAAAAAVALGAGRVQGARRRVAIGDLVGEVAPLQALVTGDDPHGLVDSFLYGVSLNKIARPARGTRNLYILPSGTESVVAEEIYRNERWRRLAIGFSEVGALLLLVAPAGAPGVDALIAQLDGALVVDEATHVPAGVRVLATAAMPAAVREMQLVDAAAAAPISDDAARHDADAFGHDLGIAAPTAPAPTEAEVALPLAAAADTAPVAAEAGESADAYVTPAATSAEARANGDAGADVAPVHPTAADVVPADVAPVEPTSASGAAHDDDEPRDARWIRRVVAAPPTRVHISAQPAGSAAAGAADRGRADTDEIWRPRQRPAWMLPAIAAAVVLVVIGIGALVTRGSSGTRTEAGRRASGGTPAARTAAAAPNDSTAATPGSLPPSAAPVAAAAGEVATTPAASGAAPSATPATTTASAGAGTEKPLPVLTVSNPGDSIGASTYAVQIVAANTLDGAKAKQRETATGLPAAVVSPMALAPDNTRWFRLTVGAFATRADAAAYASRLHNRFKLDVDPGNVVNVPYALLLAERVPRASVAPRVAAFVARGLPAYALLQRDGTARIYAGAFETPQQAALLASALTVADITPVVVYRTGRAL